MPNPTKNTDKVQVEMTSKLLSTLLNSGLLHYGDCKCLNASAKSVLWHSLLASITCNDSTKTDRSTIEKVSLNQLSVKQANISDILCA